MGLDDLNVFNLIDILRQKANELNLKDHILYEMATDMITMDDHTDALDVAFQVIQNAFASQ